MKNKRKTIYAIIPILIIISIITIKIILNKELFIDKMAYNLIVEKLRTPTMTSFMKCVTKLGDTKTMIITSIIASIIFFIKEKRKDIATIIPASLLVITSFNSFLKILIRRPRPIGYRLINITGFSFPSGHSVASMAFYGLLIYLVYRLVKNKVLRNILITISAILILLIGLSRIYLGVHYFSDVIMGYSLSLIYLLSLIKILRKQKLLP